MTSNHIDQLAQWWRDAEEGIGKAGDVVIERDDSPNFGAPSYVVFMLGRDEYENLTYRRILARAPKPKPAWHDAVAVMADDGDGDRMVWTLVNTSPPTWESADGFIRGSADLNDVTPLIEAKVTDEMVERYWAAMKNPGSNYDGAVRRALAAAFGIEAE